MKNLLIISIFLSILSCSEDRKEMSLEGVWEWTRTVNHQDDIPQDTLPRWLFKGKEVDGKFLKFFVDDHMIWVGRRNANDSSANGNIDEGAALLAKYTYQNDSLTEILQRGTDWANEFVERSGGVGSKYVAKIKIIDENTFTQRKVGDSDAREEIWERISSADDKFNLNGVYSALGRHLLYENNTLNDSMIFNLKTNKVFGDRFFVGEYEVLLYNRFTPDSLGNDANPGQAYVAKLDKINDSIFKQEFIVNTRSLDNNLAARIKNNRNIRMFKQSANDFTVSHPSSDLDKGNYRIVYFKKYNN